ncbi:DNA adenine methylase [Pseudobutyrivibrio sp. JW11]|uniref:DNA adenine methylase n=1 Tax=Pseudobutyrivibrio sp. JW11 TaxID=1855302 RepID=UPI0008E91AC4|nr:DNA adenine methylase [Pseudobutyrivibrio sp. JW11]SFO18091.1 DNA adenine methylase [Pseudobutyrivibrio sp. JW11]
MEPFVKWAGGKRQLLDRIWERTPNKFDTYYEPFIGGGAVLFRLKPAKAVINDTNEQLINIYRQLKADPRAVIRAVNSLDRGPCDKEYYLKRREEYNEKIQNKELDAECAAYMIWINKHCFNGLYRVNNKGLFNVPYNNKQLGKSIDEANLMSIGYYLQEADVQIHCMDFEEVCKGIGKNDFVYFDSPYIPVSETASFTDYTKDGFTYDDHVRLSKLYKNLADNGVKCMLSNHDVDLVYELYDGFKIESTDVKRNINSNAKKRTGKEVIITNYEI